MSEPVSDCVQVAWDGEGSVGVKVKNTTAIYFCPNLVSSSISLEPKLHLPPAGDPSRVLRGDFDC